MNLPKTPRRIAIFAEELQRKYNDLLTTVRNSAELLVKKNAQIEGLIDKIKAQDEYVDDILFQLRTTRGNANMWRADMDRFIWWFENGDNEDEQLREVKMRRVRGEKVTLDEWRAALDAAMQRKRR